MSGSPCPPPREVRSAPSPPCPPCSPTRRLSPFPAPAAGGGLASLLFTLIQPATTTNPPEIQAEPKPTPPSPIQQTSNDKTDDLPQYHITEIKEHGPDSERPWVVYEDKVYDITEWAGAHPGGEVILRAAGSSIEPYWNILTQKTPYIRETLEQHLVGKVHPDDLVDGRPSQECIEDPFETGPKRDERLLTITPKPCNAESPGDEVTESSLTTKAVEDAHAEAHNINIELPDGEVKSYTLHDLETHFKQHTVSAVLQCSDNRRKDVAVPAKKTNALQWTIGATSCAKWEGVRLRDVLADAGVRLDDPRDDAQHVHFSGLEAHGASIPITSALDPRGEVLLAFKMDGQLLPRDHGFPVRVIVPAHGAARCVKWVNKIVVSDEESPTQWQRRDHKCFGPNETVQDWDKYKSIQEMPITRTRLEILRSKVQNSDMAVASVHSKGDRQFVELEGYAYSRGGHEIQRVDVNLGGGQTCDQAKLLEDSSETWCCKRWRSNNTLPPSPPSPTVVDAKQQKGGMVKTKTKAKAKIKMTFVIKATDDAYNTPPEHHANIYNMRRNPATAWHPVDFEYASPNATPGAASAIAAKRNEGPPIKGRQMLMNQSKRVSGLHS
ncbi:hypothetical protein SLS62_005026 [Diatrype stigma]|uniref:Nitrate reductase [NADPH] n=1 Tax=Diatrype stigma TaxID=117547 RepID=A0AAN9UTG5_9PEZI